MTDELSHVSDLEHVRKRPSMYIGDTTTRGLHDCVYELIDDANHRNASRIAVALNADGSVAVTDDGRSRDPKTLERSMTDLEFERDTTGTHGGLHVGLVVVNFLAARCDVETTTAGETYRQSYRRGVAITPVEHIGQPTSDGMKIVVLPDADIFQTTQLQYPMIKKRIQELAFLRVGVGYSLVDEHAGNGEFYLDLGAQDFVGLLNQDTEPTYPAIVLKGETEGTQYHIAFQYNSTFKEQTQSYGNDVRSCEGGRHVHGFKRSLVRLLKQAGSKQGILRWSPILGPLAAEIKIDFRAWLDVGR